MSSEIADLCALIRGHHRTRVYAMDQRRSMGNRLGGFLREQLGWRRDLPESERAAVAARAAALIAYGEKLDAGKVKVGPPDGWAAWREIVLGSLLSRRAFDVIEHQATREMERLARELPVWEAFAAGIRGFGARSLAVIVAEAGPIGAYRDHSNLWKRMGLAVMQDGRRQGAPGEAASKADWIAHGYSARRRAAMFVIGECLVKANRDDGPYRSLYLARKAYERERAEANGLIVAPASKIPAARKAEFMSDGQIDLRARRYMERRLLKHLWQAWRRSNEESPGIGQVLHEAPAAETSAAEAESRVAVRAPEGVVVPVPGSPSRATPAVSGAA